MQPKFKVSSLAFSAIFFFSSLMLAQSAQNAQPEMVFTFHSLSPAHETRTTIRAGGPYARRPSFFAMKINPVLIDQKQITTVMILFNDDDTVLALSEYLKSNPNVRFSLSDSDFSPLSIGSFDRRGPEEVYFVEADKIKVDDGTGPVSASVKAAKYNRDELQLKQGIYRGLYANLVTKEADKLRCRGVISANETTCVHPGQLANH